MDYYLLLFCVALVFVAWSYFQSEENKRRIIHALQLRGATNITLSARWFDGDKTTTTYDVSYTNREGYSYQTVCKIQTEIFSNNEIFWRDPP